MNPPSADITPVIVIFAPTACGKTALAGELFGRSSRFDFKGKAEAVSADSQAVYTELEIGTAKPSKEERAELPYHLVDFVSPEKQFGLGDFMENADSACRSIWSRKKIPLVIGGTGFYIRNFLLGSPETPQSRPEIRRMIREKLVWQGKDGIFAELENVDPVSAKKISRNDEYRICRALEIFYSCGKPLSSFSVSENLRKEYDFCTIILNRPREELYKRIDFRVEKMFQDGLAEEVDALKKKGFSEKTPAMKAIGYSEFFLPGLSADEIKEKIKTDTRQYAKKQYTFMSGIPDATEIYADDTEKIAQIVRNFVSRALS